MQLIAWKVVNKPLAFRNVHPESQGWDCYFCGNNRRIVRANFHSTISKSRAMKYSLLFFGGLTQRVRELGLRLLIPAEAFEGWVRLCRNRFDSHKDFDVIILIIACKTEYTDMDLGWRPSSDRELKSYQVHWRLVIKILEIWRFLRVFRLN